MSTETSISTAGVSVWPDAVPRAECRRVVDAMRASGARPGEVLREADETYDPRVRRCTEHAVATEYHAGVLGPMRRLALALPGTAERDGWRLDGPDFCAYGPGDHFRGHRDRGDDPRFPAAVRARRYTLVCVLNDREGGDGLPTFDGGTLVVHEPCDGRVEPTNLRVPAGSLIAFPADLLHEVRPVRSGVRYSVVAFLVHPDDIEESP